MNPLVIILILMILGAILALESKDLLSGIIAMGIMGFGLTLAFLFLRAPDLALVQIIIETMTLILFIATVKITSNQETSERSISHRLLPRIAGAVFILFLTLSFYRVAEELPKFGEAVIRMAAPILAYGAAATGSANLVTAVILDFRALDTLGEATVLFTAALGILIVLRHEGEKR
ncbi:DUF4040 domain-containing protein [bacterium]|nr:DUF4040 domain-containing protein [bacterium]